MDDGFVVALPYGSNTDWLKNVLANGAATIVHDGNTYGVDRPEVVPLSTVGHQFSPGDRYEPTACSVSTSASAFAVRSRRGHILFRVARVLAPITIMPPEGCSSAIISSISERFFYPISFFNTSNWRTYETRQRIQPGGIFARPQKPGRVKAFCQHIRQAVEKQHPAQPFAAQRWVDPKGAKTLAPLLAVANNRSCPSSPRCVATRKQI